MQLSARMVADLAELTPPRAAGGRWLTDLLDAFDVPVGLLPPVRSSLDILGPLLPSAARELGLPAGVPVLVGRRTPRPRHMRWT